MLKTALAIAFTIFTTNSAFAMEELLDRAASQTSSYEELAAEEELSAAFDFLKPYNELLKKHVHFNILHNTHTTVVDYKAWQNDPLYPQAMKLLKSSNLEEINTFEENVAFWINAYNLLVIDLVIQEKEYNSILNLGGAMGSPWIAFHWEIDGKFYTLNDIQYQILIPTRESRIHFALSKAGISSPDLRKEPYTPEMLYAQLEEQTKSHLNNKTKGVNIKEVSRFQKLVYIPELFKDHRSEFASGNVKAFINRYIDTGTYPFADEYSPSNWHLNASTEQLPE